ncbi:Shedu immune nuclease family protein [Halomonas sp. HNIBRBA4712]|uniref:Shedu immune nuclease family protein n=1 Tax=Halomonas sp. HNIBRBA4712 TaxID=3373087 RepID=UPI003746E474
MARLFPNDFSPEDLDIEIEEIFPNCTEVFYLPSQADLDLAGRGSEAPRQLRKKIAVFNGKDGYISVYPIFTLPTHPDYLNQKYPQIEEIRLLLDIDIVPYTKDDVLSALEGMPAGFVKDVRYGLGLIKDFRFIISAVEEQTKSKVLVLCDEETRDKDDGRFCLSWGDYDEMRRDCNRITERARKAARISKSAATYNRLAYLLGNEQKPLPIANDSISKMLSIKISDTDKQAAMNLIVGDKSAIEQTDTVTLSRLKNDIELVSLEVLIKKYEELLSKSAREETWQKLFNDNPFILNLAFGYPAIKISGQASVGGKHLSGDGEKITDFLLKNGVTNNLAIVEIKKPSSMLLNKTQYRGAVFSASKELTGSVTQVLDQCYQLQKNISTIKVDSRVYDIESYAIHCILIIGTMPTDENQKKSLEIYRRNSKNVQIITFDEMLVKLKQLHCFLSDDDNSGVAQ